MDKPAHTDRTLQPYSDAVRRIRLQHY